MYYLRRGCVLVICVAWTLMIGGILVSCNKSMPVTSKAYIPLSFPHQIPNTPLLVMGIVAYEGAFVEGDDEEVVDVVALMVKNCGITPIAHAYICLQSFEEKLEFDITHIPANTAVMVLESSAKIWKPIDFYQCEGEYTPGVEEQVPIAVEEMESGALQIRNVSTEPLERVRIFHKNWSREAGMFLGGIAYETYISRLEPGQIILILPTHYAPGISKIVYISA